MSFRGREGYQRQGRKRGNFRSEPAECWICGKQGYLSGRYLKAKCFLCYKMGYTV